MKKILIVMLSIVMVLTASLSVSAYETNICNHENCDCEQVEFVFSNENIDNETEAIIINKLLGNTSDASTYGIMCTLFGHKYESTEYVTVITHNVRTSAPRCLSEDYKCRICSRCDHVEETLVSSVYISCC